MLAKLEESLGENAAMIASSEFTTEYDGVEWFGDLDFEGITNEQTYMILANAACTAQLQGVPATLDEYEIEINPGWNWIGFPSPVSVDVLDAFVDFEAEEGDMLASSQLTTEFDGFEWFGELETLVPGEGYMYYSASTDTKSLIYKTGAKSRGSLFSKGVSLHQLNKAVVKANADSKSKDNALDTVKQIKK